MKRAPTGVAVLSAAIAMFVLFRHRFEPTSAEDASPSVGPTRPAMPAREPAPPRAERPAPPLVATGLDRRPLASVLEEPPEEDDELDATEAAREARAAVMSAIRGQHPSDQARREAMRSALRASGASSAPWTRQATDVFGAWSTGLPGDVGHSFHPESVQCFEAGCEARVTFPDQVSYDAAASAFRRLREDGAQHGGRVQTPAELQPDGRVEATWMMLAPLPEVSR